MLSNTANNSATGTATQIPIIPKSCGKTIKEIRVKTKVLHIDSIAETLPFENAVNIDEIKILSPIKRYAME